jgi:hypothetical protein
MGNPQRTKKGGSPVGRHQSTTHRLRVRNVSSWVNCNLLGHANASKKKREKKEKKGEKKKLLKKRYNGNGVWNVKFHISLQYTARRGICQSKNTLCRSIYWLVMINIPAQNWEYIEMLS